MVVVALEMVVTENLNGSRDEGIGSNFHCVTLKLMINFIVTISRVPCVQKMLKTAFSIKRVKYLKL